MRCVPHVSALSSVQRWEVMCLADFFIVPIQVFNYVSDKKFILQFVWYGSDENVTMSCLTFNQFLPELKGLLLHCTYFTCVCVFNLVDKQ